MAAARLPDAQPPVFLVHPWQGALPRRTQALADYLLGWFERRRRALDGLSA